MIELKNILEALLVSSPKPLGLPEFRDILSRAADQPEADETVRSYKRVKPNELSMALEELEREHEAAARSYRLVCVAGSWRLVTRPEFSPWLRALAGERMRPAKLSPPALETLTIIAYRQPITRAEIEQIRGVSVDGVMQTLLERGLVEQTGRAEVVGRPMQYGTTKLFLEHFGLGSLEDLPAGEELRRLPVERPAQLVTAESGLATPPPEQLAATGELTTEPALTDSVPQPNESSAATGDSLASPTPKQETVEGSTAASETSEQELQSKTPANDFRIVSVQPEPGTPPSRPEEMSSPPPSDTP